MWKFRKEPPNSICIIFAQLIKIRFDGYVDNDKVFRLLNALRHLLQANNPLTTPKTQPIKTGPGSVHPMLVVFN